SLTLFDVASGAQKRTVQVPGNQFMTAAATPDGRTVFTYNQGGRFYDGHTLEPRATLDFKGQQLFYVALSADGTRLAGAELLGGGGDARGRVHVWDAATGKELPLNLPIIKGAPTSVVISPDGKWIASATGSGNIRLWDTATGQER